MKRWNSRSRRASVSLFLALILLAILACEWLFIRASRQRDDELRVRALLTHEADRQLAAYDSKLFEHYGLLAVSEGKLPVLPGPWAAYEMSAIGGTFTLERELTDALVMPEVLGAQIRAYMEPLYPELLRGSLINDLFTVIRGLRDFRSLGMEATSEFTGLGEFAQLMASDVIQSLWLRLRDWGLRFLDREEGAEETTDPDNPDDPDAEGAEGEEEPAEESLLSEEETAEATDILSHLFSGQGYSGSIAELGVDPSEWQRSSLENIVSTLERSLGMLDSAGDLIPDRLLLASYGLNMFSHWPHIHAASDYPVERNLRGKKLRNLKLDNRLEIEHLAFGLENQLAARVAAFGAVMTARLALNVASHLLSPAQMARHKRHAHILSIAILIISAGEVYLQPELLQYVVMLTEAQLESLIDTERLIRGQSVKLMRYQHAFQIPSHYSDYLFIYLLAVPESFLLQRIASRIETNLGRSFHTGIRLRLGWLDPRRQNGMIWMRELRHCHDGD
ncbi:MAG: DUF5702 domain-containing protein [Bacillota bacterium]|nr:DUF5702 domain-containing protein [Bacillota bacterium]